MLYLFVSVLVLFAVNVKGRDQDRIIILEPKHAVGSGEKLLILLRASHVGGCVFSDNKELIDEVLQTSPDSILHPGSDEALMEVLQICGEPVTKYGDKTAVRRSSPSERKMTIFPGTRWCGDGQEATSYDELGSAEETDKCCRDHDHCSDLLFSGQSKGNLTNESSFTLLNCNCDDKFLKCLLDADSFVANEVGNIYFNILHRECYEYNYPLTEACEDTVTILFIDICKRYARDTTQAKAFRWRPGRRYKKVPLSVHVLEPIWSWGLQYVLNETQEK